VERAERNDTALQRALGERGIETLIHYPIPPHLQQAYRDLGLPEGSLPISERLHREVLSLPIGPHLGTDEVEQVVAALAEILRA